MPGCVKTGFKGHMAVPAHLSSSCIEDSIDERHDGGL